MLPQTLAEIKIGFCYKASRLVSSHPHTLTFSSHISEELWRFRDFTSSDQRGIFSGNSLQHASFTFPWLESLCSVLITIPIGVACFTNIWHKVDADEDHWGRHLQHESTLRLLIRKWCLECSEHQGAAIQLWMWGWVEFSWSIFYPLKSVKSCSADTW